MLELEDIQHAIDPFDHESLVYPWKHADPRVDALSDAVQEIAAVADREKATRTQAFERVWIAAHRAAGMDAPPLTKNDDTRAVPFLSEPWYCCAEPTRDQLISIGRPQPAPSVATVSADSFF
jgi:hypothetical protein